MNLIISIGSLHQEVGGTFMGYRRNETQTLSSLLVIISFTQIKKKRTGSVIRVILRELGRVGCRMIGQMDK